MLFIGAMADPSRRHIAFNIIERNSREQFSQGEDGIELYRQLLGLCPVGQRERSR